MSLIPLVELGGVLVTRYDFTPPGYQVIYRLIAKGLLTPERLAGHIFFRSEDLPRIAKVLRGVPPPRKRRSRAEMERAAALKGSIG